ncbi:hypothetical protein [Streptomyces sp. NPDC101237]|uniref:hypothetical protein n=1 Tax=Streptomyces sp. NPDC101237 TaxID=3366139 RepID=UPI00382E324D
MALRRGTPDGTVIDRSPAARLASAVREGAERFAAPRLPLLPEDDAGRENLEKSLAEIDALATRLPPANATG